MIEDSVTTGPLPPVVRPLQARISETVPSDRFITPGKIGPSLLTAGDDPAVGMREMLQTLISRLDGLADRPVELSVTTNIDGRKVAEAVYKDLRERKIRNYETL